MKTSFCQSLFACSLWFLSAAITYGAEPETFNLWPGLAPGESTKDTGTALPPRAQDKPTITRVEKITCPTMTVFPSENPSGAAVVILPGGGFRYVVPDLEGSEAAAWLGTQGITAFVLNYRTTSGNVSQKWRRPLQDSQRALRLVRSQAKKWNIDPSKVGLFGFSAGGQVATIHMTAEEPAYDSIDEVDQQSYRPDFAMLVYPWQVYDPSTDALMSPVNITKDTPPAFIVHTDDDRSTAVGAALIYTELKKSGVSAELHIYQNGGHGYGTRHRAGSVIGTWKDRGTDWLKIRKLTNE